MNSVLWLLSCSILSTSLLCNSSHFSKSPVPVCVLKLAGESTDAQPFIGLDPQLTFLSLGCNVVSTISEYPILLSSDNCAGELSLLLPFWFSLYFLSWCFRRLWADSYLYLSLKISVENHCMGSSVSMSCSVFQGTKIFSTDQENHRLMYSLQHHGSSLVTLGFWYCLYLPRACNGSGDSAQTSWMYLSLLLPSVLVEVLLPNGYQLTCLRKASREKHGSNWEFSLCTWKGNCGRVTLLVSECGTWGCISWE